MVTVGILRDFVFAGSLSESRLTDYVFAVYAVAATRATNSDIRAHLAITGIDIPHVSFAIVIKGEVPVILVKLGMVRI